MVHCGTKTAFGCLAASLGAFAKDPVTKCKAHLSKAERARLNDAGRFVATGNEREDELAKEGAREDTFQAVLCDWPKAAVKTSRVIVSYIGNFILREKGRERRPDVVLPPQEWGDKERALETLGTDAGALSSSRAKLRAMVL